MENLFEWEWNVNVESVRWPNSTSRRDLIGRPVSIDIIDCSIGIIDFCPDLVVGMEVTWVSWELTAGEKWPYRYRSTLSIFRWNNARAGVSPSVPLRPSLQPTTVKSLRTNSRLTLSMLSTWILGQWTDFSILFSKRGMHLRVFRSTCLRAYICEEGVY